MAIFEREIINNKTFEPASPIFSELWAFTNKIIFNTMFTPSLSVSFEERMFTAIVNSIFHVSEF